MNDTKSFKRKGYWTRIEIILLKSELIKNTDMEITKSFHGLLFFQEINVLSTFLLFWEHF